MEIFTKWTLLDKILCTVYMFCPICVYCPIRVWDVPYAYTHMGRPYAYGTAFCPI